MWVPLAVFCVTLYVAWLVMGFRKLPKGPSPPVIRGSVPWIGAGFSFIGNPRKFLEQTRERVGDTFLVSMFGTQFFFTFSPQGLRSLYQVRDADASFTEATRGLLGLKLPPEALEAPSNVASSGSGPMKKFYQGLRPKLLQTYVGSVNRALDQIVASLPVKGTLNIFPHMKSVVHKIGFLCWVGEEALDQRVLDQFVQIFEELDVERSFQSLGSLATTVLTRKYFERRALDRMEALLKDMWLARQQRKSSSSTTPTPSTSGAESKSTRIPDASQDHASDNDGDGDSDSATDNLSSLHALYADLPEKERYRRVAIDVFQFHLASQANMYAALSWTLCSFLIQPRANTAQFIKDCQEMKDQQREGFLGDATQIDEEPLFKWVENVGQETLRLSQQSITLRKVMKEDGIEFKEQQATYQLPKGVYIATLLSITNVDARTLPTLADMPLPEFYPTRYLCAGKESKPDPAHYSTDTECTISTFGHFYHACPGKRFAMTIFKIIMIRYLLAFEFTPKFSKVTVPPGSVGAIARSETPCEVDYVRRQ